MAKQGGATGGAQSVRRALSVLSAVGASSTGVSIAELCDATGLTRPTVYRLVATLVEEGFLRFGKDERTTLLGPRFLELAQSSWSSFDLRGAAAAELERVARMSGETVRLMLRVDERLVCIETAGGEDGGTRQRIGSVETMRESAAGLAVAAFSGAGEAWREAFEPAELHLARARFYAVHARREDGAYSVAAPVFDEMGRAIAAICVLGQPHRFAAADAHALAPDVIGAARQTSRAAGGYPFALAPATAPMPERDAAVRCLHRGTDLNGDSPLVGEGGRELYWIDLLGPSFRALDLASGKARRTAMPDVVGALVRRRGGDLTVGFANSIATIEPRDGRLSRRTPVPAIAPGGRINDGGEDAAGRLWLGVIDADLSEGEGRLVQIDEAGRTVDEIRGLSLPNGIAWSADGRVLYVVDSARRALLAYDYDTGRGSASDPRILTRFEGWEGRPAGLAIDHRGRLWTALWDGWRLLSLDPDGAVLDDVVVPVPRPSGLVIDTNGEPTLYFTSARARLTTAQLAQAPLSGSLFSWRLPD